MADVVIAKIIREEAGRQRDYLALIPSENYASAAVRQAVGSVLMNKYAEGYPGKRYYQGNAIVDKVERVCQERVLAAFGLKASEWGVNVQPHSGCEANLAVYNGLLKVGDRMMAMYLSDGGHLSHGWEMPGKKITLVSKIFKVQFYHVDKKTRVFDYDQIEKQAVSFKPKLIISGGTAYPRDIDHKRMGQVARKVGAYYLADVAHEAGLIAGGAMKSPFPYADVVTFTTHKTFRGPRGAVIVARKELMEQINFSVFPGLQGGPHLHTIAGIAVAAKEIQSTGFKKYAKQVVNNAKVLAKELTMAGFDVVSGGTDKHLVLIDLRNRNLSGWVVAWALEAAGIVANRNAVPYETASPFYPSGIRLGTPAITSRGMKEREMRQIAKWINDVVEHVKSYRLPVNSEQRKIFTRKFLAQIKQDKYLAKVRREGRDFTRQFPVPGITV